jgi:hypothetical protein
LISAWNAFWEGPAGPRTGPSLILRITPAEIHLGCGVPALAGAALDRYRSALRDMSLAADLDTHVAALLAGGAELSEPTRLRPSPGFGPAGPAARFAVRDGFHMVRHYRRPAAVTSARLVPWCASRLAPFSTVHQWLTHHAA